MIGGVAQEGRLELLLQFAAQHDADRPQPRAQRGPLLGKNVARDLIETAEELAGLEVDVVVPFLEAVEFFQDRDRDGDVVFFKIANAAGVVQDDIRVEDEELGIVLRRAIVHRDPIEGSESNTPPLRSILRGIGLRVQRKKPAQNPQLIAHFSALRSTHP